MQLSEEDPVETQQEVEEEDHEYTEYLKSTTSDFRNSRTKRQNMMVATLCSLLCTAPLVCCLPFNILWTFIYIMWTYSFLGLVAWEIAPLLSFFLFVFLVVLLTGFVVGIIVVQIGVLVFRSQNPSRTFEGSRMLRIFSIANVILLLVAFSPVFFFSLWGSIPAIVAPMVGSSFENQFLTAFGKDFMGVIPPYIQARLKHNPFSYAEMLFDAPDTEFEEIKDVKYGSDDPKVQYFDIFIPKNRDDPLNGTDRFPVIITVHGGASESASGNARGAAERDTAKYFAGLHPIIVVSPEYRSPPEAHFVEMVTDIRSVIVYLKQHASQYRIDPNQIFLLGRSRGGHLVTTAAYGSMTNNSWYKQNCGNYAYNDLTVRGVINLYGAVDAYDVPSFHNPRMVDLNENIFGVSIDADPDLYRNGSAPYLVAAGTPPTLTLQGMLDKLVVPDESRALNNALKAHSIPRTLLLEYAIGQHGFDGLFFTPGGQIMVYFVERFFWFLYFSSP